MLSHFSTAIQASELGIPAPEFTHTTQQEWLNSKPLKLTDLRGKVVLIDVWTFGCWNCYRSFPWLNALEQRYAGKGLQVIGVHSPEFDHERDTEALKAKLNEFKLTTPQMIDNDFSYWKALGNQYWPAFYLIDKYGLIQGYYVGETHEVDARAKQIEAKIAELLAE
ncbi:MAG TPA: redoxin domain-containing protein [Thiolinea sp.]|nr:redoxin domain-containing protein [Thiolinea sp.]